MPYWAENDFAACPVEWQGLFKEFADAPGIDLLQALHQAADIDPILEKLRRKYDFYWPSGEPYHDEETAAVRKRKPKKPSAKKKKARRK